MTPATDEPMEHRLEIRDGLPTVVFTEDGREVWACLLEGLIPWMKSALEHPTDDPSVHVDFFDGNGAAVFALSPASLVELARSLPPELLPEELRG